MTTNKNKWAMLENGYVHTSGLSEKDCDEMILRYTRIFPDLEFCKVWRPDLS